MRCCSCTARAATRRSGPTRPGASRTATRACATTGGPPVAVDAFFSLICPGLWTAIEEASKDRYRANGDIGFTDLRSPALDVTSTVLSAVTVPVLVIAGDTSHPSLRSVARRLAAALPDARFITLEECGHVTYIEKPDDFFNAVSVFAGEIERRTTLESASARRRHPPQEDAMSNTTVTEGQASRFDVRSADGIPLAVWVDGSGPPLVMVHGSIADHTTFDPFVEVLRDNLTTFSMDRRGFGASGEIPPYAIERDFEDVAAVVDAVAGRTGGPVALWGHSYGANCAMGGAALTSNVNHLVLYEPSPGLSYPPGCIEGIEDALAAGDMDAAIVAVLVGILEMTEEEIDSMRSSPLWPVRLAAAPHRAQGVPSRGQLGVPTRPVRRNHGSDTAAFALREPFRSDQGDP